MEAPTAVMVVTPIRSGQVGADGVGSGSVAESGNKIFVDSLIQTGAAALDADTVVGDPGFGIFEINDRKVNQDAALNGGCCHVAPHGNVRAGDDGVMAIGVDSSRLPCLY